MGCPCFYNQRTVVQASAFSFLRTVKVCSRKNSQWNYTQYNVWFLTYLNQNRFWDEINGQSFKLLSKTDCGTPLPHNVFPDIIKNKGSRNVLKILLPIVFNKHTLWFIYLILSMFKGPPRNSVFFFSSRNKITVESAASMQIDSSGHLSRALMIPNQTNRQFKSRDALYKKGRNPLKV